MGKLEVSVPGPSQVSLLTQVFIPLLEILPRLMQEPQPATPYHSNPAAVFPPAQSRDLIPNPSPFYPPEAQKQQEHTGELPPCPHGAHLLAPKAGTGWLGQALTP